MNKNDGMNYAPVGRPMPVVKPGEFAIAAVALDHGHIYGIVNGLLEAGAALKWVYDRDPARAGELILDCLNRTENAMTQEHAFLAAELCLKAQANAVVIQANGAAVR